MPKITLSLFRLFLNKVEDLKLLTKFKLSALVVFTSLIGFLIAEDSFSLYEVGVLCFGGFFITGAANAFNQVLERPFDKIMKRTSNRPLPSGRMNANEAILIAGVLSVLGLVFLATLNPLCALIGGVSLLSYAFVYTPLKRYSPIAVLVGAFPGAFPPLIGWVASTGEINIEAISLFSIQFLWQFPHFWAIAWVAHEDYTKAGFFLLPSRQRDKSSALAVVTYAGFLIPVALMPYFLGVVNEITAVVLLLCSVQYFYVSWKLYKQCSHEAARIVMFSSFFYLPIVMLSIFLDSFITF